MSLFLLDANVLIALAWPDHQFHNRVMKWFVRNSKSGWTTCPITQCAFVRILSNPAFSSRALSPQNALATLEMNLKHPGHRFWPDEIPITTMLQRFGVKLMGHRQVTDAYLLALALHHRALLATMDESIAELGPGVEVLPT